MGIQLLILIFGFIVLIKGADFFVDAASSIAKHLNVPDMLIGLTIVAFGTSAPEAAVSIKATLSQNSDMVLGNIIGSNILNIVLILGIATLIAPIHTKKNTIKIEIPFLFLVSVVLALTLADRWLMKEKIIVLNRLDGLIIVGLFSLFLLYLIKLAKEGQSEKIEVKYTLSSAIVYTLFGLVAIILGGNFVVNSASTIATLLGVSQRFVALSIVALGTSLPELVTSVVAATKGEQDLAIGNVIGSNIFNICFVAGLPALLFGNITPKDPVGLDLAVAILVVAALWIFAKTKNKLTRAEGVTFLLLFVIYYGYLIFSQL